MKKSKITKKETIYDDKDIVHPTIDVDNIVLSTTGAYNL
jgi:hypothetical protein